MEWFWGVFVCVFLSICLWPKKLTSSVFLNCSPQVFFETLELQMASLPLLPTLSWEYRSIQPCLTFYMCFICQNLGSPSAQLPELPPESLFLNIGSQVYSYTIKTNSIVWTFIMEISNDYFAYESFLFFICKHLWFLVTFLKLLLHRQN